LEVLLWAQVKQPEARVDAEENLMVHRFTAPKTRAVSFAKLTFVEAHQTSRVPINNRAMQQLLESYRGWIFRLLFYCHASLLLQ
jgi:hypothetical protein